MLPTLLPEDINVFSAHTFRGSFSHMRISIVGHVNDFMCSLVIIVYYDYILYTR